MPGRDRELCGLDAQWVALGFEQWEPQAPSRELELLPSGTGLPEPSFSAYISAANGGQNEWPWCHSLWLERHPWQDQS